MYKRNPYTSTLNRKQLDDEDENTLKVRKNSDSGFRNLPYKSVGQESKPKNLPGDPNKPATIQKLPQRIPTDIGDAFGIDAESKKRLSDLRTRFIGQSNGREGTRIKNSVQGVLSNKYGKLDTQHIFDDIDDDTVERNIDVAKSAINTNIERGTLSKDYKTKYPNLLDGMTMFYAAGEKGNSKAMSKSKEAAYSENSLVNLSNKTDNSQPTATSFSDSSEKKDSSENNYMTRYTGKNGASYREDTSEESEVLGQISGNSEVQFTGRKRIDENDKAWAQVIVDGKKVWVDANDLRLENPNKFDAESNKISKNENGAQSLLKDETKNLSAESYDFWDKVVSWGKEKYSDLKFASQVLSFIDKVNQRVGTVSNIAGYVANIVDDIFVANSNNTYGVPSENYEYNKDLDLSKTGALDGAFINEQGLLKEFRYGASNISDGGCGIIAMYNILQGLGKSKNFTELIYENENSALLKGALGTSPSSITNALRDYGFEVTMDYSGVNEKLDLSKNDAVIHLYFRSDMTAHYVAGISNGDGTFCFYNSDTGDTLPMTWKEYFRSTNIKNKDNIIYSCVYKVNIKG